MTKRDRENRDEPASPVPFTPEDALAALQSVRLDRLSANGDDGRDADEVDASPQPEL